MKTSDIYNQLKKDLLECLKIETQEDLLLRIYDSSSMVQYSLEEFFSQYNPEEIGKGQCNLLFKVDIRNSSICTFQLKDMYNCCGMIVASDLFVAKNFRHKGIGTILTKFIIDFCTYYGYGVLQATDRKDNHYSVRILEKLGWTKSSEFLNPKTGNVLLIWIYPLSTEKIVTI